MKHPESTRREAAAAGEAFPPTRSEALAGVTRHHPLNVQHKFVFELGWREYFRHLWAHHGDGILQSLCLRARW